MWWINVRPPHTQRLSQLDLIVVLLPQELAQFGKIPLSKVEVSRKIGELYMVKSSVNLMFDILDAPDYFWDYGMPAYAQS